MEVARLRIETELVGVWEFEASSVFFYVIKVHHPKIHNQMFQILHNMKNMLCQLQYVLYKYAKTMH